MGQDRRASGERRGAGSTENGESVVDVTDCASGPPDRRGRHGNHVRGERHPRWNAERILNDDGYVLIRVGRAHPLADVKGYALEAELVAVTALGRPLADGEVVHHRSQDKTDNRWENLEVLTRAAHANLHNAERGRDELGRWKARADVGAEGPLFFAQNRNPIDVVTGMEGAG